MLNRTPLSSLLGAGAAFAVAAACRGPTELSTLRQATAPFDPREIPAARGMDGPLSPRLLPVAFFLGPMPGGVAVSPGRRVFVSFPRWGDRVEFSTGELHQGQLSPFPDDSRNRFDEHRASDSLISVRSVLADSEDRLWLLDAGSIEMRDNLPNGPKLLAISLRDGAPAMTVHFWPNVALATSCLYELRIDLARGNAGTAFCLRRGEPRPVGNYRRRSRHGPRVSKTRRPSVHARSGGTDGSRGAATV